MTPLPFLNQKDVELEATVSRAILSRGKAGAVQVVIRDGYVHLLGWVDRLEEKREINQTVEAIPGVRIVTNHIHVKPWEEKRNFTHF